MVVDAWQVSKFPERGGTLVINVGEPNQVPTFTLATNNVVVLEDSGAASSAAFLTSLSAGEVTQSVTNLTTSNNNSNLFSAQPTIAQDGTLTFKLNVPATRVAGSVVSDLAIYPSPAANLTKALERLLQQLIKLI